MPEPKEKVEVENNQTEIKPEVVIEALTRELQKKNEIIKAYTDAGDVVDKFLSLELEFLEETKAEAKEEIKKRYEEYRKERYEHGSEACSEQCIPCGPESWDDVLVKAESRIVYIRELLRRHRNGK